MSNGGKERLCYVILGSHGSGRRRILLDLIETGFGSDERVQVLLPATEPASPDDLLRSPSLRWVWKDAAIQAPIDAGANAAIFVCDGRADPVDQVEALKPWLAAHGLVLARVICVVDCRLVATNPQLRSWFEACIHFSDVVLLNHREGLGGKWLGSFLEYFKKQHFPCLFELVKDGRVANPALVLEPQARRVSHYFEAEEDWILTDEDGEIVDSDEEDVEEGEEELEATPAIDPYLARDAAGRRAKRIPDIARFLPPPVTSV